MQKMTIAIGRPQDFDASDVGQQLYYNCGYDNRSILEVIDGCLDVMTMDPENYAELDYKTLNKARTQINKVLGQKMI